MTNVQMTNVQKKGNRIYDLNERTFNLAARMRSWIAKIPKQLVNFDDLKQLVRSSGSVAANTIEADEAVSRDDFKYRIKVCRKEAKESKLWLRLIRIDDESMMNQQQIFIREYDELVRIFTSIIHNTH